ncbi:MAG: hypothetical protein ACOCVV_06505 [Marinobacter sp.]
MVSSLPDRLEGWLSPLADVIGPVYPWLNGLHVLSIGLLGAIVILDLRLLGAFRTVAVSQLAGPSVQVAAWGLASAITTGLLLFSVQPAHYLSNPAFLAKLAIVAIGLINTLLLRLGSAWQTLLRDRPVPARARAAAGASLASWTAAIFAGRWIAYL